MEKLQSNKNKLAADLVILTILVALIANAGVAFAQTPTPVSGAFVSASGNGYGYDSSDAQGFYNINPGLNLGTAVDTGRLECGRG